MATQSSTRVPLQQQQLQQQQLLQLQQQHSTQQPLLATSFPEPLGELTSTCPASGALVAPHLSMITQVDSLLTRQQQESVAAAQQQLAYAHQQQRDQLAAEQRQHSLQQNAALNHGAHLANASGVPIGVVASSSPAQGISIHTPLKARSRSPKRKEEESHSAKESGSDTESQRVAKEITFHDSPPTQVGLPPSNVGNQHPSFSLGIQQNAG